MKFSWKSLNQFIDLKEIEFNDIINKLTLAGFEIDGIENKKEINDKIIDLNITANRQDTLSTIGLAREISNLIKKPCLINNYKINNIKSKKLIINEKTDIHYISITIIKNLQKQTSPKWLIDYLQGFEIKSENLILDTIKYTQIKWGQTINILDISEFNNKSINNERIKIIKTKDLKDKNKNINKEIITYNDLQLFKINPDNNTKLDYNKCISDIIILAYIYKNNKIDYIYKPDLIDGYNEVIHIIKTYGSGIIGNEYYYSKDTYEKQYQIKINKNKIQKILGPIKNTYSQYIKTKVITNILYQLKLQPEYSSYTKIFSINIPPYRRNDLKRDIDIIEEIGRIYGYQNFIDKLPTTKQEGLTSYQNHLTKKIRKTLRDLGLHEVINSSLINDNQYLIKNNNKLNNRSISIYNPLLEDQSILRKNLIDNLIRNKIYNNNQKNKNLEIFEIGKIFYQNLNTEICKEEISIAGILSNNNFIKQSWEDKSTPLNWFHAKGIIEDFFEKLETDIIWETVNNLKEEALTKHIYRYYNPNKTTIIKNPINNTTIGILGELSKKFSKNFSDNQLINIFEINLQTLIETHVKKTHLDHTLSYYSRYPNVIRDISIKINKNIKISEIKQYILEINQNLIEDVEIFNEYYNKINNDRNVGLRITYRSFNRTLNNKDIQYIDQTITNIFNYINNKSKP
uniref:phenylalanine--tRNA ligase n=1 Tax=Pterothamnion crispum TaxID=1550583 RepID=A0A4D6WYT8_9FLOR|nr:Phenylalanine-tRNA ligase beta subunit [Pterothamnion crispum]